MSAAGRTPTARRLVGTREEIGDIGRGKTPPSQVLRTRVSQGNSQCLSCLSYRIRSRFRHRCTFNGQCYLKRASANVSCLSCSPVDGHERAASSAS
ncbi:unnamed protein product [Rangifer tarandus platyrhynchus]|uniref:Uncharacterized protein n=1 Tax=Rangifer tarandus platyrhynchus TaxID=3082113 RepID=A0ACB1MJU9_RANTA